MPQLLLAGYLGCGNLGDDAMMLGFAHALGGGYDYRVLSGRPEETYRIYGFDSTPRREMKLVEEAIRRCDALVFPGGSIFQDVTSQFSAKYYADLVSIAKKANKKVFLLGQGVGPLSGMFPKRWAAAAFNAADGITVRDPMSVQTLKNLGVNRPVRVSGDSALLLPQPPQADDEVSFGVGNMKSVGVAPRPLGKKDDVAGLFAELCRLMYQSGTVPVLVEMDRDEDGPLIQEIHKRQGGRIPQIRNLQTPMQFQQRIRRMEAVIAMRLHAGILSTTVGIPSLMVSYDPKVTAFAKLLELGPALDFGNLTANRLFDTFTSFMNDRDRNLRILDRRRSDLIAQAMVNVEIVREQVK